MIYKYINMWYVMYKILYHMVFNIFIICKIVYGIYINMCYVMYKI